MNTHGHTRNGRPVHRHTIDFHRADTAYQRFNKAVAAWLTDNVGSMTCYWIFTVVSLFSLPAVLAGLVGSLAGDFPSWATKASLIAAVAWVSSNYLQLTLLPAIMVGQNLQSAASDVRATKQFEDTEKTFEHTERILDLLDVHTQGGLNEILTAIKTLEAPDPPEGE